MRIDEIVKITGAKVLSCKSKETDIETFSTDTRTTKSGDFYLPLKGESFDGEKFIAQAIEKGAIGYFTTSNEILDNNLIALKVTDTKIAYLQLARAHRKEINPKVVMITGSSGKTTTKELVSSVCSQKFKTFKTPLNHNNEIGLCQTIFNMPPDTEVLIIEGGMRGLGEIEIISEYALPDISIICNVGTAHIGRLGSRENIAKAKCEITKFQNPEGTFIGYDNQLIKDNLVFDGEKIFYSINDTQILDKKVGYSKFVYQGEEYELNIEGDYNIENSLAAINTGKKLGMSPIEISEGLKSYKPIEKRWESKIINNYEIINDSYNANPESMKAAISTIFELYPKSTIILGDMGELGENEKIYHSEVGEFINQNCHSENRILTIGTLSNEITKKIEKCFSKNFSTNSDATKYILENIQEKTTIFLKASRAMKFEEIIEELKLAKETIK